MVARCAICLLCLWVWLGIAPVQSQTVDIAQSAEWSQELASQAKVYNDASGTKGPAEVAGVPDGQPGSDGASGFVHLNDLDDAGKLTRTPWWIKVRLANGGDRVRQVRLMLRPGALFHSASFYVERNGQWVAPESLPDAIDAGGPGVARYHSSALRLPPGARETVLIRATGIAPSQMAPYLYTDARLNDYLAHSSLWDGLLLGGLLALAWAAWMLALFSRSRSFLLLGSLSFMTMLVEGVRRGYDKLFLPADAVEWSARAPLVLGGVTVLLFVLFILQIARSENIRLPLRPLMNGWAVFYISVTILAAFGDVHDVVWLNEHVRPFFSVSLLIVAILFIRRNAPTRKLMLAVAIYSVLRAGLLAMETGGTLPDYIDSLSMGVLRLNPLLALSGFFFNLALLAAWIAYVGRQRKTAMEKVAALQRLENERLEQEVARQTAALSEALAYADEKNRQQTQILGYVSHDLRAPLATIAGYTKLLEQTASKEQELPLNAIARSVDYQMTLIDDILGYAAAELKPLSLAPETVHLGEYLDEIAQHATALSRQQNNAFHIEVTNPLPRTLWVDGRRLRQVLLNLLSNAAKFTRGGSIVLSIAASREEKAWRLYFVVSDSGIGIDPQQQARIFKEFRQLDPSAGGVGLGLYIAQSILRSMGAELNLDSSIGQGATFSFEIRVAAVNDEVIDWTAPTSLPGRTSARLQSAKPDPVPPAHERSKLAILAQGGHLTDIERWLQVALNLYPACTAYLHRVQEALSRLDLDTVERLALAQTTPTSDHQKTTD